QLLPQCGRQIGLAVKEQRSNVILQRAPAPALVIEKPWLSAAKHDVARLKIAVEKEIVRRAEQELGEPPKITFQRLLVEGNSGQAQKVILEVIQVPGNRLPVEARARIADLVIQIAPRLNLEARQHGDRFAI